jgi:membrane associated rhomboid family serine protease
MSFYRQGPMGPSGPRMNIGVPSLTPMVKTLMIVCGVIWAIQLMAGRFGLELGLYLGVCPYYVVRGWVWQPFTYMFLHSRDPFHLLFNMLMLWMFGGELERLWGSKAFLRYFIISGIGGGIGATLLGLAAGVPYSLAYTIGASGAIFGVFVAYGMIFAERTVLFMLIFPMKARTMVWIMIGLNAFYLVSQSGGNVSYIAHIAGGLAGYLYLKRAWRVGEFYKDLKWKLRRRKIKVVPPRDPDDRWLN